MKEERTASTHSKAKWLISSTSPKTPSTRCTASAPWTLGFHGSIPGPHVPLSTLRYHPCERSRMTRGRCGSLRLHRVTLSFTTPCRLSPALHNVPNSYRDHRLSQAPHRKTQPHYVVSRQNYNLQLFRTRLPEYRRTILLIYLQLPDFSIHYMQEHVGYNMIIIHPFRLHWNAPLNQCRCLTR